MPISKFTFDQDKRMVAANLMGIPTKDIAAEFDMPVKDVSKRLWYLKNKKGVTAEDIKEPQRKVATINKEFDDAVNEMQAEIKKEPKPEVKTVPSIVIEIAKMKLIQQENDYSYRLRRIEELESEAADMRAGIIELEEWLASVENVE